MPAERERLTYFWKNILIEIGAYLDNSEPSRRTMSESSASRSASYSTWPTLPRFRNGRTEREDSSISVLAERQKPPTRAVTGKKSCEEIQKLFREFRRFLCRHTQSRFSRAWRHGVSARSEGLRRFSGGAFERKIKGFRWTIPSRRFLAFGILPGYFRNNTRVCVCV